MKYISAQYALNEETRKQGVWMLVNGRVEVFSLHITPDGEAIITDNKDYSKIYAIYSLDFYNAMVAEPWEKES